MIVAKNEEKNIGECLASVAFASEVVLVDDFSEDATGAIAETAGAKVFRRALNGDWGAQQTFAIEQATQDWILLLDCDERITPELAEEIRARILSGEKCAYAIKRVNHFKRVRIDHGVLRPDFVPRLMPRAGTRVEGLVHQRVIFPYPLKKLRAPMLHFTYDSWGVWLKKIEHYTRLAAEKYDAQGKRAHFARDIVFRPFFAFFKVYVLEGGFLEGRRGWVFATVHFFYVEMKYARLYSLQRERAARSSKKQEKTQG